MKNSRFWKILILSLILNFAFLIFSFSLHASGSPKSHETFWGTVEFRKHTLSNGLTVLHAERHNLPIVMVTLLIKASPLNEPDDKAGIAYLTAKMLTEGTKKRKASEISEEIEFMGASLDASTSSDYTTISLSVLRKDVEKGFEIFSDVLQNPLFPEEEIKRKKEIIKGSLMQSEEDPSFVASKTFIKEVFGDHPYGRLVNGSIETIDSIKRGDIVKFYNEHYISDNAILSVVGDITPNELNSLIDKYLGRWKTGDKSQQTEVRIQTEKKHKDKKIVIIDKNITQANIIFGHRGIARDNPDYYAVSVMNYILGGGGFASRLMKVLRDDMGLTYSIYSSFSGNKEIGQFEVEVQTKNESAGTAIREILKQINKIKTEAVTEQELNDAKAYLTGSFPRRLETSKRIADFLAAVEFYKLGDDYIKRYPDYINQVTKEDVLRVAKKYLNSENYVLVIVGDKKKIDLSYLQPSENIKQFTY
ncbi:insulinase family protein [hot springs metagenome]|uniref:Insulinase family protein n=1 Tax=hot springs metagenome TaxID=433727 RepID=A0A5J4L4A6_9ZZZZ